MGILIITIYNAVVLLAKTCHGASNDYALQQVLTRISGSRTNALRRNVVGELIRRANRLHQQRWQGLFVCRAELGQTQREGFGCAACGVAVAAE